MWFTLHLRKATRETFSLTNRFFWYFFYYVSRFININKRNVWETKKSHINQRVFIWFFNIDIFVSDCLFFNSEITFFYLLEWIFEKRNSFWTTELWNFLATIDDFVFIFAGIRKKISKLSTNTSSIRLWNYIRCRKSRRSS